MHNAMLPTHRMLRIVPGQTRLLLGWAEGRAGGDRHPQEAARAGEVQDRDGDVRGRERVGVTEEAKGGQETKE